MLSEAIGALNNTRDGMDKVYGPISESSCVLNALTREGSLKELLQYIATPLPGEGS